MNPEQASSLNPILIAEDNANDAVLLQMVFQRARILNPLQIVHDGEQALHYIRAEGAYADRKVYSFPILCLLDLKMPRKGGMDVLRLLRENPPQQPLPIVVTAGRSEMREVNCAYSLGARSFLVKPLTWLDVMEVLSCFRELRLAACGDKYVLEPVEVRPLKPVSQKPILLSYKPQPLDTSRLKLTDDILRLTELLAENNHEVWARDRMAQGWTYGPKRDDEKKEHPCLIPYRDLPESEKLLDRNVAMETIKTIFSFGLPYPVLEKATDSVRAEVIENTLAALRNKNLLPEKVRTLWEEHNVVVWTQSVELYRQATGAALRFGEAFLALDIAAEGLKKYQTDLHLRRMQALALAQTGAVGSANDVLDQLRSSGGPDEEQTLATLACTYRDLWACASDAGSKRRSLKLSFELFSEAYRRNPTYLSGINAAFTGLLYGEKKHACQMAREVEQMCREAVKKTDADDTNKHKNASEGSSVLPLLGVRASVASNIFTAEKVIASTVEDLTSPQPSPLLLTERKGRRLDAHSHECCSLQLTLAESLLIQGNLSEAGEAYRAANKYAADNWQLVNRARAGARLLLEKMGRSRHQLDACFKLPRIAVCSGLMFDKPEQPHMRFPFGLEIRVREEMRQKLAEIDARIGFSSLASGADLLFAETILERGGELNLVLPCNRHEFKMAHVEIIPGAKLGERFDQILSQAASVTILDENPAGNEPAIYEYGRRMMIGQALLKARRLDLDVLPLAVWDGRSDGETQNFIHFWETRQTSVEVIRVDKIIDDLSRQEVFPWKRQAWENTPALEQPSAVSELPAQTIKAVLFVDIVGHNRLSAQQFPTFVQHLLMRASGLLDALPKPPIVRNSWGDTIHCVFDEVAEAGSFALALQELVHTTDWMALGLPETLNVRITLHAGPVYPCVEPVSGRLTFLGGHANRTTRIEPIAEEGQIYATEAFAALSETHGTKDHACHYVGQKYLPKRYGTVPVFIVRRPLPN